jgi:hypothetical protein
MNPKYEPIMVFLLENKYHWNKISKVPAHDFVLKPLLENCLYSYVYGIKESNELYQKNRDILIREKGRYRLDTTKECVYGHEHLWSATGWERGSIIIILKNNTNLFNEIFKYTYNPCFFATPNMGNTISAVKKCREEMENGNTGICLSASNGMEWIQIYARQENIDELFELAEKNCKRMDYSDLALKHLLSGQ